MRAAIGFFGVFGFVLVAGCFTTTTNGSPDAGVDGSVGTVTYYKDIAPIVQNHCQMCHVQGGIAPFALATYDDAKTNVASMVADTQQHIMPPFGARTTSECAPRFAFKGDMSLNDTQIATIKAWHDQGDVAGNPADAPPPNTTPIATDLVGGINLSPTTPYTLKGTGDYFRCYVLDPQITAQTYVTGVNIKPGNKTIVHHALIFSVPGTATIPAPTDGVANQYDCFGGPGVSNPELVALWAPGAPPYQYPASVAHPLDAGTKLIMQVHYHPHANATTDPDTTTFQYSTTTTKPTWTVGTALLGNYPTAPKGGIGLENPPFYIQADKSGQVFTMDTTSPAVYPQVRILSVAPHMHLVGVDQKVTLTRPAATQTDPQSECLVQTPAWNFNWQRAYEYDTDITSLPLYSPGDVLKTRCTYDNTMNNPILAQALTESGQKQTAPVTLGETTLDEMCLTGFWYVYPTP